MKAAIKSLTPKVLRDFVLTAILSRWEGDRDWGSVDVEIRQFKYLGIGESNEPIEFYGVSIPENGFHGCVVFPSKMFVML